jgi:hypothetical protein
MENLLPLAAYDVEETGYWARLPFLSGLLYGLLTVIIDVVYARADAVPPFSGVPGALFTLVTSATFLGLLFPWVMRAQIKATRRGLFARNSWIVAHPPENRHVDYRVLCSLVAGGISSAVSGVIYVGRGDMVFVPHKRNRRGNRHVLNMAPLSALGISMGEQPGRNLLQRILIPRPQPTLQLQWPGGCAKFLVPSAESFLAKLSELTAKLRA